MSSIPARLVGAQGAHSQYICLHSCSTPPTCMTARLCPKNSQSDKERPQNGLEPPPQQCAMHLNARQLGERGRLTSRQPECCRHTKGWLQPNTHTLIIHPVSLLCKRCRSLNGVKKLHEGTKALHILAFSRIASLVSLSTGPEQRPAGTVPGQPARAGQTSSRPSQWSAVM